MGRFLRGISTGAPHANTYRHTIPLFLFSAIACAPTATFITTMPATIVPHSTCLLPFARFYSRAKHDICLPLCVPLACLPPARAYYYTPGMPPTVRDMPASSTAPLHFTTFTPVVNGLCSLRVLLPYVTNALQKPERALWTTYSASLCSDEQ